MKFLNGSISVIAPTQITMDQCVKQVHDSFCVCVCVCLCVFHNNMVLLPLDAFIRYNKISSGKKGEFKFGDFWFGTQCYTTL